MLGAAGGRAAEAGLRLPSRRMAPDLLRNVVDALPAGELERKLAADRPLRVKLGVDPTTPDLHLGHTVVLGKLREFQDAGHRVVLIIGDYTARVGDPSGRARARPLVSGEQIDANARTYQEQASTVLRDDPEVLEVRWNSEWLDMSMEDLFRLARTTTVAQVLEREDVARRWAAREPIALLELLYPLLQGYDSVAVRADVEIGGTDQRFNLLLGRDVQRAYGMPEQAVLTLPILVGTDGVQKMSKSLGNSVGVSEPPAEQYGKTLSLPDEAMGEWYRLLLGRELDPAIAPREAKRALARAIVTTYHGEEAARAAEARFDRVFVARQAPEEVPSTDFRGDPVHVPALLADAFGISRSEARRLIAQDGVRLDDEVVRQADLPAAAVDGRVLRAGKRRFVRLRRVA